MVKITELVTSIIQMDKDIDALKIENRNLRLRIEENDSKCSCENITEGNSTINEVIYEMGLQSLYKKVFYSWHDVKATRKENGEIVYTSFDQFINSDLRIDEIPERVSKFECIEKLKPLLMEKYEEQCVKAYDRLLESEKEESEEDE